MAQFDEFFNQDTAKGLAIGIGAAVLAPVALSVLSGFGRPAARAAIKSGIILYERSRETLAEVGEVFDDLVAEARYELEQDHRFGAEDYGEGNESSQEESSQGGDSSSRSRPPGEE